MTAALLLLLLSSNTEAHRFGFFVGSNGAPDGREPLQHAQEDAKRMRNVFLDLGEVRPEDAVLLEGPDADELLRALETMSQRIASVPDAILLFYYSGHADDRALLLGSSELALGDLLRALESVPARISLHLIDACRSGALTRKKGARLGERFSVNAEEGSQGRVVITSSAEWEDSQESDRLGGSFFTLHLASALRGAADHDADGRVTLSEAYRYVYGRTVESTIATAAGPQHPTFRYDLRGRGEVTLTWVERGAALLFGRGHHHPTFRYDLRGRGEVTLTWVERGAALLFGRGHYLVVDEKNGSVVAEVESPGSMRVALAPGDYRLKKRTRDELFEGTARFEAGRTYAADELLTDRIAHARLVRKGGARDPIAAHGVRFSGGARGRVAGRLQTAPLFRLSYELALPWLSLSPYFSITAGAAQRTPRLVYEASEIGAGVGIFRAFDIPYLGLRIGLLFEATRLSQKEAGDRERDRTAWGFAGALAGTIESPPFFDFVIALTGEAAIYSFPVTDSEVEPAEGKIVTSPTWRALATLGYEF